MQLHHKPLENDQNQASTTQNERIQLKPILQAHLVARGGGRRGCHRKPKSPKCAKDKNDGFFELPFTQRLCKPSIGSPGPVTETKIAIS